MPLALTVSAVRCYYDITAGNRISVDQCQVLSIHISDGIILTVPCTNSSNLKVVSTAHR